MDHSVALVRLRTQNDARESTSLVGIRPSEEYTDIRLLVLWNELFYSTVCRPSRYQKSVVVK